MTQRETDLESLRNLQQRHQQIQKNKKSIEEFQKQKRDIQEHVLHSQHNAPELYVHHARSESARIDSYLQDAAKSSHRIKYWVLFTIISVLCILMFSVLFIYLHTFYYARDLLVLTIGFIGGMLLWGSKCICLPLNKFFKDNIIGGFIYLFLFALTTILPIVALVILSITLYSIHVALSVLPVIIFGLTIYMVVHRRSTPKIRPFTIEEAAIDKAKALDNANEKENRLAANKAKLQAQWEANEACMELDSLIKGKELENSQLQKKIDTNDLIHPDQVKYVDRLIGYLEHRYANNIQEALLILKDDLDKEAKWHFDMAMSDMNSRFERYENEKRFQAQQTQQALMNAAAERRAKELNKKLDDLQKDFEYHQKNGW